jgi:hypothetical protein
MRGFALPVVHARTRAFQAQGHLIPTTVMITPTVMLTLFQHPFLNLNRRSCGQIDPEPKASEAKQVQGDENPAILVECRTKARKGGVVSRAALLLFWLSPLDQ